MSTERQDTTDRSRGGVEESTDGLDDVLDTIRDMYAANPETVVAGSVGLLVAFALVVGYALVVSPLGTLLAVGVWVAFTLLLVRHGKTYGVIERSALGAGLFLLGIPTAVRLVTKTTEIASGLTWAGFQVTHLGALGIVLLCFKFTWLSAYTMFADTS